jgi:hypothetical protein
MPIQLDSKESSPRTRVLRPRMEESAKPLISDNAADKLANAIRKSWIQERSGGTVANKRA